MKGRVLIIDDEKNVGFVVQAMLERAGYETLCFQESPLGMEAIESEELDAVITDLYLPGPGGMEVLEFTQRVQPQLPVVVITAFGTIESAVNALKKGAFDFITKPFEQADLLMIVAKAVATHRERMREPIPLFAPSPLTLLKIAGMAPAELSESILVGESEGIRQLRKTLERVAPTDATVLLEGESGTGKETLVQEIHVRSSRREYPLIRLNCAVIPPALLDAELFGSPTKPGRVELAQDGTLFLDEVGELSAELQTKLLQLLGENEAQRPPNFRLIVAGGKNLAAEVQRGTFLAELFYRLNVFTLKLPPLRERTEDIEGLVKGTLLRVNRKFEKHVVRIEPECLTVLTEFGWPGNLRQLDNVMERMVLLSEGDTLRAVDLPEEFAPLLALLRGTDGASVVATENLPFKERVRRETQNVERELILRALDHAGGNVTRTAEDLGLSRKGLQLKMKELGIRRE